MAHPKKIFLSGLLVLSLFAPIHAEGRISTGLSGAVLSGVMVAGLGLIGIGIGKIKEGWHDCRSMKEMFFDDNCVYKGAGYGGTGLAVVFSVIKYAWDGFMTTDEESEIKLLKKEVETLHEAIESRKNKQEDETQ